jgi:hypothetical protein
MANHTFGLLRQGLARMMRQPMMRQSLFSERSGADATRGAVISGAMWAHGRGWVGQAQMTTTEIHLYPIVFIGISLMLRDLSVSRLKPWPGCFRCPVSLASRLSRRR